MKKISEINLKTLNVKYNGHVYYKMNPFLLNQQNAWANLDDIKEVHWLKLMFYDLITETKDKALLRELAKDVQECEFELQRLWGFTQDVMYHRFWETPKCSCPKMDNNDEYPNIQYVNLGCVLHGDL